MSNNIVDNDKRSFEALHHEKMLVMSYRCDICMRVLETTSALNEHRRTAHNQCDICNKILGSPSSLAEHRRIHLGIRPYVCDVCGKSFTQGVTLDTHKRIHTGEKPFKCGECDKCFTQQTGLIRHMISHTGIKPFKCTICSKAFTRSTTLIEHMGIHDSNDARFYTCSHCGVKFRNLSNLGRHERAKHSNLCWVCMYCKSEFNTLSYARTHHKKLHPTLEMKFDTKPRETNVRKKRKNKSTIKTVPESLLEESSKDFNLRPRKPIIPVILTEKEVLEADGNETFSTDDYSESSGASTSCQYKISKEVKLEKCSVCNQDFDSEKMLEHLREHETTGQTEYECSYCHCIFNSWEDIVEHFESNQKCYIVLS